MRRIRRSGPGSGPRSATAPAGHLRRRRRLAGLAGLVLAPLLALVPTGATADGVWLDIPPLQTPRAELAAAPAPCPPGLRQTCVYAFGGRDAGGLTHTLEAYSPATNAWITLAPLPTARTGLAGKAAPCPEAVKKKTCVYAVGGSVDRSVVGTVEAYNPAANTWIDIPPLPTPRSDLGAAPALCPEGYGLRGACVYAVGGRTDTDAAVGTVEAYSPATGTWATLHDLPTPRAGLAVASAPCPEAPGLRGLCVYAFGGRDDAGISLRTVEVYSPVTNAWLTLRPLPTARDSFAVAPAPCSDGPRGRCLYVFGGVQRTGVAPDRLLDTVQAYSPVADTWSILPPLRIARSHLAVASAACPKTSKGVCLYPLGGFVTTGPPFVLTDTAEAFAIKHELPPARPTLGERPYGGGGGGGRPDAAQGGGREQAGRNEQAGGRPGGGWNDNGPRQSTRDGLGQGNDRTETGQNDLDDAGTGRSGPPAG
ncbi:Kelch repeat-containing protein [Streptomyces sp. MI02-7b]|uniref:Kelch repeat-containing protein n=1 Tax=Streptomyces sp. MI02-7b TaxID=462941 RepID=UPI0029B0A391|nr:kelch repeat-containing protein [Streptomyces sp. MI02-7b]MDX3071757.1 kelch repeat-containing protein [Streptomyces sp. MI02-7b]